MQHRIKRAGTDAVAVARQFLDHPLPVEIAFGRMVQDVKPYESRQQLLVFHLLTTANPTLSGFDIGNR